MLLLTEIGGLGSAAEFQSALTAGLTGWLGLGPEAVRVTVAGALPTLDLLEVDVSGGRVDPDQLSLSTPEGIRQGRWGLSVRRFEFRAQPLWWAEEAQIHLLAQGQGAQLHAFTDANQDHWLMVSGAAGGTAVLEMKEDQLENLVLATLRRAAGKLGLSIKDGAVELVQSGKHSLGMRVKAAVGRGFLRGKCEVSGQLLLNDHLDMQLRGLTCSSHGAVGSVVVSLLKPLVARWEGTKFSLLGPLLANLQCDSVKLNVGQRGQLRVEAGLREQLA